MKHVGAGEAGEAGRINQASEAGSTDAAGEATRCLAMVAAPALVTQVRPAASTFPGP
jgi:hypothetical protein